MHTISNTVASAVEEQSATMNEISKSVSSASFAANDIAQRVICSANDLNRVNNSISEVKGHTHETAQGVDLISTSAQSLTKSIESLKDTLKIAGETNSLNELKKCIQKLTHNDTAIFKRSIQVHVQWKLRLISAIYTGIIPDRHAAGSDDECEFGKWLQGEAKLMNSFNMYSDLVACHRRFHSCVGEILDTIIAGNKDEAISRLKTGALPEASAEVTTILMKMHSLTS